jgi:uncharacterized protein YjaG (DUF416 family)
MELNFFDLENIQQELEYLPPLHRLSFAASICERLLPNYLAYHRTEEWGINDPPNPNNLRIVLDEIWQVVKGEILNVQDIERLLNSCEVMLLDGDSATSRYYTEAINAINALCDTLKACLNPTPENIIQVVKSVKLTIADFITCEEESVDPSWGERALKDIHDELANHPFTIRERTKQNEDLQRLKEVETLDRDFLEWLRTSFDNAGRSLIDLS